MFQLIRKTLRENKIATGIIFILVFILIYGPVAVLPGLAAIGLLFLYLDAISGDDDGDWPSFPDHKDPRFA